MTTTTAPVRPNPKHPACPTPLPTPCRVYRGPKIGSGYGAPTFRKRQVLLHRWIIEQAEGLPLGPGEVVMHLCDNPPCFRLDHLRRATHAENMADAKAKGRTRNRPHYGEANGGGGKLTQAKADEIRRRWEPGTPWSEPNSTRALAAEFGVGETTIRNIGTGKWWVAR